MKNLVIYYLQIIIPLPLLYLSSKEEDSAMFFSLFIFYLVYRIFTDYFRLLKKGVVMKSNFFMFFMPIWHIKYFKELYFEN